MLRGISDRMQTRRSLRLNWSSHPLQSRGDLEFWWNRSLMWVSIELISLIRTCTFVYQISCPITYVVSSRNHFDLTSYVRVRMCIQVYLQDCIECDGSCVLVWYVCTYMCICVCVCKFMCGSVRMCGVEWGGGCFKHYQIYVINDSNDIWNANPTLSYFAYVWRMIILIRVL